MPWQRRVLRNRLIFESNQPDPVHVAVLAGVHGDEHVGFYVFQRLIERLHREPLRKGRLSLIPGNVIAATRKRPTRCAAGQDLNRLMLEPSEVLANGLQAAGPDFERAQQLMPMLSDVDYSLDIHSTSAPCEPFVVTQDANDKTLSLLAGFPVSVLEYGHRQLLPGSTMDWVERCGGVGITVQCGQHHQASGRSAKTAHACTLALLRNLGMLPPCGTTERRPIRLRRIVHRGLVKHPASLRYEPWFKSDVRVEFGQVVGEDMLGVYRAPTREQVAAMLQRKSVPDALSAIMVTPPSRVARVRPHDAFLLGIIGDGCAK